MSFKKRVGIGLSGIFLGIIFVFWLRINQQKINPPGSESEIGKADVKIKNMDLLETTEGKPEWRLRAEEAELFEKQGVAYLKNIVLSYTEAEGQKVVLTGDRGKIHLSEKNIFIEGNVEAFSNQIQLNTEALSWFQKKQIIVTDRRVRLKQKNIEITGQGMTADINLRKITLQKQVKTKIY